MPVIETLCASPGHRRVALQEAMLLDERWMSYAAGLKDDNKRAYFDTTKENPSGKITAHPCQYWAISWPFVWNRTNELLKEPMPPSERGRGVHYTEDVVVHTPLMANTNIRVSCMAVDASQRKNGCTLLAKFDCIMMPRWTLNDPLVVLFLSRSQIERWQCSVGGHRFAPSNSPSFARWWCLATFGDRYTDCV